MSSQSRDEHKPLVILTIDEMKDLFDYTKDRKTGLINIHYSSKSFKDFEEYLTNEYKREKYKIQYTGYKVNPYNQTHLFLGKPLTRDQHTQTPTPLSPTSPSPHS